VKSRLVRIGVKHTKEYDIDFKRDLKFGLEWENELKEILCNDKIEVKTDKRWSDTGNIAIEIESRGKPSGLSVTKSDYWAFILWQKDERPNIMLIPIDRLRTITSYFQSKKKVVMGGDANTSKLVLVPLHVVNDYNTQIEIQEMVNEKYSEENRQK
jgi:hypothetical protein